jgi:type I restriction enzyme S subunit
MTPQEFLDEFGTLAESAEGVPKLRELILELAVRGKLVEQDESEGSGQDVLDAVAAEVAELVEAKQIKKPQKAAPVEPDEVPFEIPASWRFTRLESVSVNIHYGYTASANHDLSDVLFVRITDIQDNGVAWETVPGCEIEANDVGKYELGDGDLLVARTGGTIGKTFLVENVPQAAVFASYLIRVVPSAGTSPAYLKRFLESPFYWKQLYAKSAGTGQPNVNATSLKSLVLPLPPLAEQQRIVAKVDELMGLCDRLEAVQRERRGVRVRLNRASLERLTSASGAGARQRGSELSAAWQRVCDHFEVLYDTPETLPDLRQTILQLAVQGKLVPQNPNDEPAEKLRPKIETERRRLWEDCELAKLAAANKTPKSDTWKEKHTPAGPLAVDEPYEVATSWAWVPFAELCANFQYGPRFAKEEYVDDGIPTVRTSDMTFRGDVDLTDAPRVNIPAEAEGHWCLKQGDLLVTRTGATIGKCALYDQSWGPAIASAYLIRFRMTTQCVFPDFVQLFFMSPFGRELLLGGATEMAQPNVNATSISGFPFPLAPLSEQKRIVSKVTHLLSQVTRLESMLTRRESTRTQLLTAAIHALLGEGSQR